MQRVFSWFGRAARYVANTRVGKLAAATHLSFLNEYLKRPISPEQFAHGDSINLSDLHFKADVRNFQIDLIIFKPMKWRFISDPKTDTFPQRPSMSTLHLLPS
jgi:hypothetical protein